MKRSALLTNDTDTVATALDDLTDGQEATFERAGKVEKIVLRENIPFGHKFALADIQAGDEVLKYGEVIGRATSFIGQGMHVHVHNLESLRGRGDLEERKGGAVE